MDGLNAGSLWPHAASAPPRAEGAGGRVGGSCGAPVQLRAWWGAVACVSHRVGERVVLEPGTVQAFQSTSLSAGSAGDMGSGTPLPLSPAPQEEAAMAQRAAVHPEQCSSMVLWFLKAVCADFKADFSSEFGGTSSAPSRSACGCLPSPHLPVLGRLQLDRQGCLCHGEPEGRFHSLFSRGREPCGSDVGLTGAPDAQGAETRAHAGRRHLAYKL